MSESPDSPASLLVSVSIPGVMIGPMNDLMLARLCARPSVLLLDLLRRELLRESELVARSAPSIIDQEACAS